MTTATHIWFAHAKGKHDELHYFVVNGTLTFCNRVIYSDWYKSKYQTLEKVFGPSDSPYPRQPHECRECYDAVLEFKRSTFAGKEVSRSAVQPTDADSLSDIRNNGTEDSEG